MIPVLDHLLDRYRTSRPLIRVGVPLVLLVGMCCIRRVPWGGIPLIAAMVTALVCGRMLLVTTDHAQPRDVNWAAVVDRDLSMLRHLVMGVGPRLLFVLTYAVLTGSITAVVTELVLRRGTGLIAGSIVAVIVSILALAVFNPHLPPGWQGGSPWYGIGPWAGLWSGLGWGAMFGLLGAFLLFVDSADATGGMFVLLLCIAVPLSCALLVAIRAVLALVSLGTASIVSTAIRRFVLRHPDGSHEDPLGFWRAERASQLLRFGRAAVVTVVVALSVSLVCRWIGDSSTWEVIRRDGLAGWPAEDRDDVGFVVTGHLRYVAAAVVVLLPSSFIMPGKWRWIWLASSLATSAVIMIFWPRSLTPDTFRVGADVDVDGSEATFSLSGLVHLPTGISDGRSAKTIDLAEFVAHGDYSGPLLVWSGLIAFFLITTLYGRIERGYSRVWWTNWLTTRWHVVRGRLPRDLMVFLDDAHRLGLLRAVGSVYQFRHAELQDHLATGRSLTARR